MRCAPALSDMRAIVRVMKRTPPGHIASPTPHRPCTRRGSADPLAFSAGIKMVYRNGDTTDPSTGLKCTLETGGVTAGSPTTANITTCVAAVWAEGGSVGAAFEWTMSVGVCGDAGIARAVGAARRCAGAAIDAGRRTSHPLRYTWIYTW